MVPAVENGTIRSIATFAVEAYARLDARPIPACISEEHIAVNAKGIFDRILTFKAVSVKLAGVLEPSEESQSTMNDEVMGHVYQVGNAVGAIVNLKFTIEPGVQVRRPRRVERHSTHNEGSGGSELKAIKR